MFFVRKSKYKQLQADTNKALNDCVMLRLEIYLQDCQLKRFQADVETAHKALTIAAEDIADEQAINRDLQQRLDEADQRIARFQRQIGELLGAEQEGPEQRAARIFKEEKEKNARNRLGIRVPQPENDAYTEETNAGQGGL